MYKKVNKRAKWVAIDSEGVRNEFELKPTLGNVLWLGADAESGVWNVSEGHDSTNWQNSLIEINAQYNNNDSGEKLYYINKEWDSQTVYGIKLSDNYVGDWKDSLQLREEPKLELTRWDGEGLPPVGIKCEAKHTNGSWYVCETIGCYQGSMVCATGFGFKNLDNEDLRPIKTEREKTADKAIELTRGAVNRMDAMYKLYDAGMLKLPEDN